MRQMTAYCHSLHSGDVETLRSWRGGRQIDIQDDFTDMIVIIQQNALGDRISGHFARYGGD